MSCVDQLKNAVAVIKKDKKLLEAAQGIFDDYINNQSQWLACDVIDILVENCSGSSLQKEFCLNAIAVLSAKYPEQVKHKLVDLIPAVCSLCGEAAKTTRKAAFECVEVIVTCNGNQDLEPLLPVVLQALKSANKNGEAVEELASCVFVQNVEAAHLAVVIPILKRGLRDNQYETKRKCCVIIDNMCKLIDEQKELHCLMPEIKPLVDGAAKNISNPEARQVAGRCLRTLNESYDPKFYVPPKTCDDIKALLSANGVKGISDENVTILKNLCNVYVFDPAVWSEVLKKPTECEKMLKVCEMSTEIADFHYEDTEEGLDLYKGSFSLAYGTLTLLKNANVHLKRNRFYGLLGPNNCGKTTLMRAIAKEQIEGFPKKDELKTIFVEHEIEEREVGEDETGYPIFNIDLSGADWVVDYCNNVCMMEPQVTKDMVLDVMEEIGFGSAKKGIERAADVDMPVTTYSGGWKMKMQLCAATLLNADILMLDEPTGHLDVRNIQWIKDWLKSFMNKGGSIICTSHDSSFLNEMCTHIIDFQKRKLVTFRGILTDFVEKFPEKKGYFELKNDLVKFVFPEPGILEGVKSMSKSILKMNNCTFTYPTRTKPTVTDITLECSRASRVAVIGPNGAGKSTAIKLLIGELKPSTGTITKHPNLRLAYVAQHAFAHLERHMTKTPTQYIMWRFAGNEDKEGLETIDKNEEEMKIVKFFLKGDLKPCNTPEEEKQAVEVEQILARRENKKQKTKEYECKFKGKSDDANIWIERSVLIKMGAIKLVQKHDEREAAAQGLMSKPLTTKAIEAHLGDFGLEPEHASHTLVRSLSGGQKVKVVLAASLWQNPHLVILDEPTNYLDRDALGALVKAIDEYKGGVVVISHNREFANAICQEKWIMEAGRLRREGESVASNDTIEKKQDDDVVLDSFGNEIKVERQKTLTDKEKKQEVKKLTKQLKDGKKKGTLSDDEIVDLELKIEELKVK